MIFQIILFIRFYKYFQIYVTKYNNNIIFLFLSIKNNYNIVYFIFQKLFSRILNMYLISGLAFLIYITRMPERFFKGN